jgi:FkbM family methyltransferase
MHRLYGSQFDDTDRLAWLHSRARTPPDPERRLRVGVVSPDLKQHSVAYFLEPLLAAHDRRLIEYFAYANVAAPDAVTARLQAHVEHWRTIFGVSDESAARQIETDRIDILIDIAGHTANNRLALLARRPAPVQMTYLGYANTTGLQAVDWRLTDGWADPPGTTEALHTEELLRIPGGFLCYRPREPSPAPGPPPVISADRITFGSFNILAKVSPTVLALWARILDRVPGARLILKGPAFADPATKAAFQARLADTPLSAHDVALVPHVIDEGEHLAAYQRIDIALDTWPYHGTTTTCEALWMGVPVVTLAGRPHASRVGVSLLSRVGLPELVGQTPDEYVSIAAGLAADRPRLLALRGSLRERVVASGLTDAAAGAAAFEGALREAWRGWCRRERARATAPAAGTALLPMAGDVLVAVSDTLEQITPYVLAEQGDWFEDEAAFVRRVVCRGDRVIDVGANHGVYALPLARGVGVSGHAFIFEPEPTVAARLRQSLVGNGLDNVTLIEAALSDRAGESTLTTSSNSELAALARGPDGATPGGPVVAVTTLDASTKRLGIRDVAFVKMDAEGAEPAIFDGGREFFSAESPLVMFEVRHGANIHRPTLEAVSRLGYDLYRLIPGLDLLAPWPEETALDPYQLNMFACKRDRAALLQERGLLARTIDLVEDPPADVWVTHLRPFKIAEALGAGWRGAGDAHERSYYSALDHHALAHRPLEPAAARVGHLIKAVDGASAALGEQIRIPTLQTVARLAWEAGYRAIAVETLNLLIQRCQLQGAGAEVREDLPFLPVSPRWDRVPLIDGDLRRWILAGALEQRELLRAFSSYYTAHDPDTLTCLTTIADLGYQSPEMARRLDLVRRRRGLI